MRIVKRNLEPSREDAVRLTRSEKKGMLILAYAATVLDDLQTEMADRIAMIPDGPERLKQLSEGTDKLLQEIRLTVPMNQRTNLQNTASDFEMRLVPKATPSRTSVLMQKEEFRELVDCARIKCRECMEDDEACEKCGLFQLLTVVLPLENYHSQFLCPYNLGEWAN